MIDSINLHWLFCFSFNSDKKVKFTENTIDNEHLNRKKSKCCCIYEKPKIFGDPSSSSSDSDSDNNGDDEPDCCPNHCHGPKRYHKQVYKKQNGKSNDNNNNNNNDNKD